MERQIERNRRRSFLFLALFFLFWIGVGAGFGWLWSVHPDPATGAAVRSASGAIHGMAVAALMALGVCAYVLGGGGTKVVMAVSGARPADPGQYLQFHDIVEALAIGAGLPKPALYVIDDPSPNAFATGTSARRAAVAVTTGLLQTLNREELEGVLAHEISHIKNHDIRFILITGILLGFPGLIASFVWHRARRRSGGVWVLMLWGYAVIFSLISTVIGPVMQMALSRSRETLADVSSVDLTRNPAGLLHALQKLQSTPVPFVRFNHVTAAMCIDDPLQHHRTWWHQLYATHPPLEARIALLEQLLERG